MDPAGPGGPGAAATLSNPPPGTGPSGPGEPWARFDDVPGGHSQELRGFVMAITAATLDEVAPALSAAERAASDGAWVAGFVAYEAAAGLDPALTVDTPAGPPEVAVPLTWFGVFADRRAVAPIASAPAPPAPDAPAGEWMLDTDATVHARRVAAVRDHIAAGDVYQCNLTARYHGRVDDPFPLYCRLVQSQRTAHGTYLSTGGMAVASASPELFFDWVDDTVTTRPMKGTAARGRWSDEDRAQAAALGASAKDRAENVMIVDLLRNDLGKVAAVGTVAVPALWTLERYPTVWQLTSTVTARVGRDLRLVDLLRAVFPSGSVTGAPKRRAMQVIAGLEDTPRGVYCGALGVLAPPGAGFKARFTVPIRTVVVDQRSGTGVYGSGGGIVWDSAAPAEYEELRAKAAVLSSPDPGEVVLLETMLSLPGCGVCRWDRHRARVAASAEYFDIAVRLDQLDEVVGQSAASSPRAPSRVRLLVDRHGAAHVEVDPLGPPTEGPVLLEVDGEPVDVTQPWVYHKTTYRSLYESRAARHPAADQVVLINKDQEVTETTVANLAVKLGGRWWTPPVASGCLPGVARGELVECGRLQERRITVDELWRAEAVAVISALRGWRRGELLR